MKKNSGFTFLEVLISTTILALVILSTLSLFIHLLSLAESDRDLTIQQHEDQSQMETICAMSYSDIKNNFTNNGALKETRMSITNDRDRSGTIYAQELATDGLIRIKVVVCYLQKNRTIGEDANFNGVLDSGEDANGNGELDSSCQTETVVAKKE